MGCLKLEEKSRVLRVVYRKDTALMLTQRGYTAHEHFYEQDIIHMNGRIYDPKLRMFLSPDVNLLDPTDSQHFNRYSYALNNPLKYTDPSGNLVDPCGCAQSGFSILLSKLGGLFGIGSGAAAGSSALAGPLAPIMIMGQLAMNALAQTAVGNALLLYTNPFYMMNQLFTSVIQNGASWASVMAGLAGVGGAFAAAAGQINTWFGWYSFNSQGMARSYLFEPRIISQYGMGQLANVTMPSVASGLQNPHCTGPDCPKTNQVIKLNTVYVSKFKSNIFYNSDWLDYLGGGFGAAQTAYTPGNHWLGLNGKYNKMSWGGNRYTGARARAFRMGRIYKWLGRGTVIGSGIYGGFDAYNGYQMDGENFGYNFQYAAASNTGNIAGGWAGAWIGFKSFGFGGTALCGPACGITGAIIGGFVGGLGGGFLGGSLGESGVNYLYNK
jgi:RHS repeat-associated protein